MLLSLHILDPICNVNDFSFADQSSFTQGSAQDIYFQLIDLTHNPAREGYSPAGLRYMPATGATLQITLTNIDNSVQITRFASQPFPQDVSIWKVAILSGDQIYGTCDAILKLTEPVGKITNGKATNVFSIESAGQF